MAEQNKLKVLDENWQRTLAVVAHPDDLEYGAASAVARWTSQGKPVSYLLATRGEAGIGALPPAEVGPLREQEEIISARIVGVDTVEFLDYPDGVIEYGRPLRRDIARAVRRHRPEVLITLNFELTWGGMILNMADHRWLGLAVLDAARDAGNRWIFPELLDDGLSPGPTSKRSFAGSTNPVEVDSVAADMLGYSPRSNRHIALRADAGLGLCDLNRIKVKALNQPTNDQPIPAPLHFWQKFACRIKADGACCT